MKYDVKDLNAPSRWNMRIWDNDNGEWLCQSNKDALTYYGFDITGGETTEFQGLPKWHPDRHLIWEQSTGLKDKNGKEIYEGDILRFKGGSKSIVKFCEMKDSDCTYFYLGWASVQDGNEPMSLCEEAGFCEVIGNIHENPELMEEEP